MVKNSVSLQCKLEISFNSKHSKSKGCHFETFLPISFKINSELIARAKTTIQLKLKFTCFVISISKKYNRSLLGIFFVEFKKMTISKQIKTTMLGNVRLHIAFRPHAYFWKNYLIIEEENKIFKKTYTHRNYLINEYFVMWLQ